MTGWALVAALVLLAVNAFFVAVEFALVASRRTRLETMAEGGSARARIALRQMQDLNVQLAGAQLGITMASLGLGFVAEPAVAHLIDAALESVLDLPSGLLHTISFVVSLTIVVFLHMVLGEMVPKNVAIAGPERTLLRLAPANRAYVFVFGPLIRLLTVVANSGVRALGVEPRDELTDAHTAEEFADMLAESRDEGLIEEFAHELLSGALDLGDRPIESVMVDRRNIVALTSGSTVAEAEALVVASGHSRLPIIDDDIDDVRGFVHAKDLLTLSGTAHARVVPARLVRRMLRIPMGRSLADVLLAMRAARVHLAVVQADGGATAGIVTLEDVLEELVGEIADESDQPR